MERDRPAGPAGAEGRQGDTGETGDRGPQDLPGPQGEQGEPGPQGDPGPKGDTGAPGRTVPDTDTYHIPHDVTATGEVGGNAEAEVVASCPQGQAVTGGGFTNEGDLNILASHPAGGGGGWLVRVKNHRILPGSWTFGAWAICASPIVRINS